MDLLLIGPTLVLSLMATVLASKALLYLMMTAMQRATGFARQHSADAHVYVSRQDRDRIALDKG